MFNFTRAGLSLEQAAKSAAIGDDRLTAHYLGKAERLILKSRFNDIEVSALIALYDRVLAAALNLSGTIPIRQNCEEMKKLLQQSILEKRQL